MCSGTRSVGSSTMPSGNSPSSIAPQGTGPRLHWAGGRRTPPNAASQRLPGCGRAPRRGPHRRRRPLPGDGREPALQRSLAARAAPPRERGPGRAAPRRNHPRATNQDEGGAGMSELSGRIKGVIEQEPVALFMKGTPQFVMCGNSDRALRALREAGAPVTAVDILPDPAIRQELSTLSGWPTIPQVFVRGELIGGADIVEELEANGELESKLEESLGADYRNGRAEKTVAVV